MKTFIAKIIIFCSLLLLSAVLIVCTAQLCTSRIDWKLPPQKHILFMGASHIVHAVNDTMLPSAVNVAKESERYMFTYIKLCHLLEQNEQIDTIFLECGGTDLFENADDKYFKDNEMTSFYARYYPFFDGGQWMLYVRKMNVAFGLLYRKTLVDYLRGVDYTYFSSSFPPRTQVMNPDSVYYRPVQGQYGHRINYAYLHKIIQLCEEKQVQLYLLYCPVYKPEYYYDQAYFYRAYQSQFGQVELLDYSHFPMAPDERYDAHHLNDKGARRFTQMLKSRFGL